MSAIIDPDKRYTTGQAAKLLGYSRATLVVRINAGQIKATQLEPFGKGVPHRRVQRSELLRVLGQAGYNSPPPPPAPKRRSNAARRDGERALKELGLA